MSKFTIFVASTLILLSGASIALSRTTARSAPESQFHPIDQGYASSAIVVHNVDPIESMTLSVDFADAASLETYTMTRPGVAPWRSEVIWWSPEVFIHPTRLSAIARGDHPIAALARTEWDRGAVAFYEGMLPARHFVVPVMAAYDPGFVAGVAAGRHSSVLHLQNPDRRAEADVALVLRDSEGRQLSRDRLRIGGAQTAVVDQSWDSILTRLPASSIGSLEIESTSAIALSSHLVVEGAARAVSAFAVQASARATNTLIAPLLSGGFVLTASNSPKGSQASWMLLVNPNDRPTAVRLRYQLNDVNPERPCDGIQLATPPVRSLAAMGLMVVDQREYGGPESLPEGCVASARVEADLPIQGVVVLDDPAAGNSAAYRLMGIGESSKTVAISSFHNMDRHDQTTTAIQVMNPNATTVRATLILSEEDGSPTHCPACSFALQPGAARLLFAPAIQDLSGRRGIWLDARVESDSPILATVLHVEPMGMTDSSSYGGVPLLMPTDSSEPRPRSLPYFNKGGRVDWDARAKRRCCFLPWVDKR